MTIQLRKASFRLWLEAQEPAAIVGRPVTGSDCPLARFLKAQGCPSPLVSADRYRPDSFERHYVRTPAWAQRFIRTADDRRRLTARICLQLLEVAP